MEMRSLVNRDSEFRADEWRPRSVVRAARSMRVPDLDHSRVLHLVTSPPAVIYGTRLRSLRAAEGVRGASLAGKSSSKRKTSSLLFSSEQGWLKTSSSSEL